MSSFFQASKDPACHKDAKCNKTNVIGMGYTVMRWDDSARLYH